MMTTNKVAGAGGCGGEGVPGDLRRTGETAGGGKGEGEVGRGEMRGSLPFTSASLEVRSRRRGLLDVEMATGKTGAGLDGG